LAQISGWLVGVHEGPQGRPGRTTAAALCRPIVHRGLAKLLQCPRRISAPGQHKRPRRPNPGSGRELRGTGRESALWATFGGPKPARIPAPWPSTVRLELGRRSGTASVAAANSHAGSPRRSSNARLQSNAGGLVCYARENICTSMGLRDGNLRPTLPGCPGGRPGAREMTAEMQAVAGGSSGCDCVVRNLDEAGRPPSTRGSYPARGGGSPRFHGRC